MEPKAMNINLTPEQEKIVKEELKSGHFHSIEEVIGEALQVLSEKGRSRSTDTANGAQREAVRNAHFCREESSVPGGRHGQGADSRGPPSVSDFVRDASLALQWFLEDKGIENTAWPSLLASPKNAPWSPSCGSMKLATASSWPAGASESPSIRLTVS
jgi:Arc/MetJ-type ribon-helix-helix transcriptional regulator